MKRITSIEIINSEFYGPDFQLNFSDKLNCLMGGRGTGKSTILHFIKACIDLDAEEDKTTYSILKNNLGSGLIKLYMETEDGTSYRIEKSFGEEPQPYLVSNDRHVPFENIRKELTSDIFPAQMIETIGRDSRARLDLIDRMLSGEIEDLVNQIELNHIELERNAKEIRAQNQKLKRGTEQLLDYASAEDDLKNHRAEPPQDVNEKERTEFEKQDAAEKIRSAEKRFLDKLSTRLAEHNDTYSEITSEITSTKAFAANTEKYINKKVIDPLAKDIEKLLVTAHGSNISAQNAVSSALLKVNKAKEELKALHDQQHNDFVKLKQKLEKHKVYYDKLNALSKRVDEKNVRLKEIEDIKELNTKLKKTRANKIKELNGLKKSILDKRSAKIKELNALFDGKIRITLSPGGITDEYEDALRNALKGHNLRYNTIVPYIVDNFTPDKLAQAIHDYDAEKLKTVTSIDLERSSAVLDALYESDAIYQIETIYCPDLPDFHLKIDKEDEPSVKSKDNYKKSDELSTGQRCTTVLPIVFAISENPLIIDQPEDNLDNKYISNTIHEIIKEQKATRQLIFITHNANIPVLSDAEKNMFLKYVDKKSNPDAQGTIQEVKDSILSLLEGGKDAFEERKRLYGF